MPDFEGKRGRSKELIQASADYRTVVITVFQNVADTLHAIQSDADFLEAAARSEKALKTAAEITRKQYKLGYASYQMVMAEQSHQQSPINLIRPSLTVLEMWQLYIKRLRRVVELSAPLA